jgi:predicted phosphodiesterase
MRIAVLADIHGNLAALQAALAALDRLRPDRIVVAGDVVDGAPDSAACWELVKTLDSPIIRGNHERYVFDYGTERAVPEWSSLQFGPLQATIDDLTPAQRAELRRLPLTWADPEDAPGLLAVHASQCSDADSVLAYTPDDALAELFPGPARSELIVRGHNHQCNQRRWDGTLIVTVGAVGLPLDGNPAAQFTTLDRRRDGWHVDHHAVPYDVDATLRRFRETDYLERSGPMGRLLMREFATAAHHMVPFLRFYRRIRPEGVTLEHAVERFLDGM